MKIYRTGKLEYPALRGVDLTRRRARAVFAILTSITRLPLRRAVRFKPGEALRYA